MRRTFFFLFLSLLLPLMMPACGPGAGTGGASGSLGTVVVGVTSDLRVGVDVVSLHVLMHAAGAVVLDEDLTPQSTTPLQLPMELPFTNLPGGTPVDVALAAYGPGSTTTPLVTRLAATTIVAGKKLLLEVGLDSTCISVPGSTVPACAAPQTCVSGLCAADEVAADTLPAYTPGWSTPVDPCKPPDAGPPEVVVGEGEADYIPLMNGDTDQVEAGPQGGHHVWVAVRTKNLHQSGSITSVTGHFPDLGIDVGPFNVIFTMDTDEGGWCKLYGLRFQLDQTTNINMLLGHPLDITVTVTDTDGSVGTGTLDVVLSQTFLM
jgi:hypothetical protein